MRMKFSSIETARGCCFLLPSCFYSVSLHDSILTESGTVEFPGSVFPGRPHCIAPFQHPPKRGLSSMPSIAAIESFLFSFIYSSIKFPSSGDAEIVTLSGGVPHREWGPKQRAVLPYRSRINRNVYSKYGSSYIPAIFNSADNPDSVVTTPVANNSENVNNIRKFPSRYR